VGQKTALVSGAQNRQVAHQRSRVQLPYKRELTCKYPKYLFHVVRAQPQTSTARLLWQWNYRRIGINGLAITHAEWDAETRPNLGLSKEDGVVAAWPDPQPLIERSARPPKRQPLRPAVFSDNLRIISKPRPHQICNSATANRSIRLIGHQPTRNQS
jgi:hypothetical protein